MTERGERLARAGLVAAVAVAGFLTARAVVTPVRVRPDSVRILDFAYYANISRAFWAGEAGNPYSADALLRAFGKLAGRDTPNAMPIGVSPSAFLLWWPVAKLADRDLELAHAAWVGVSLAAIFAGLGLLARDGRGKLPPLAGGILLAAVLSSTFGVTLMAGQITLVAVAALVALWKRPGQPADRWGDVVVVAGLLLVLAIKPTYLLPAGVALLAQRRWRVGVVGGLVVAVANLVALSLMDAGTAAEFVASLRIYSSGNVPAHYADTFRPEVMASFTSAFGPLLGMPTAFAVAQVLSGLSALTALGLAVSGRVPGRMAVAAAVGGMVLLTPYLGSYEDLLLLAVVGVLVRDDVRWPALASGWGLLVPAAWLLFNRQWVLDGLPLWTHWGLKLVLAAGLVRLSVRG